MNLGTFLVLIAVILAAVDAFTYHRTVGWHGHWLLSIAVFLGFLGVLLGATPIRLQ